MGLNLSDNEINKIKVKNHSNLYRRALSSEDFGLSRKTEAS